MQISMWNFDQPITLTDVLQAAEQGKKWVTRKEIADALRRAKSPSLIAKINELVSDGYLACEQRRLPNGVDMLVYSVTKKGFEWLMVNVLF